MFEYYPYCNIILKQKMMANDSDGLKLNSADTTIKLKSSEKVFDELEVKDLLVHALSK